MSDRGKGAYRHPDLDFSSRVPPNQLGHVEIDGDTYPLKDLGDWASNYTANDGSTHPQSYHAGNLVTYSGSRYICTSPSPVTSLPTSGDWQAFDPTTNFLNADRTWGPIPSPGVTGVGGVTFDIEQSAHGFVIGDVLRYNPDNIFGAVTFVASAQATDIANVGAISATIPAGLAAGHVLILKLEWNNTFGATNNTASAPGFTRLDGAGADNYGVEILFRVLDGSEAYISGGGSVTVTMAGTDAGHNNLACFAIGYSGCSTSSPFDTVLNLHSTSPSNTGYSTTYTTVSPREKILTMLQNHPNNTPTVSAPAGTLRQNRDPTGAWFHSTFQESNEIALTGAHAVTASWTGAEYAAIIVALRPHGAGNVYVKAQADNATDAEVVGIVSAVADSDHFTLMLQGHLTGLSGLTVGSVYFLSAATAGALTTTEPSVADQVSKPLLTADSTISGFFLNNRGKIILNASDSGSSFGGGSGGGGGTVLFDSTLGADGPAIDTLAGGVAGGYRKIEISIRTRSSIAAIVDNLRVTFNGDTAAHYSYSVMNTQGAGAPTTSGGGPVAPPGAIPVPGNTAPASHFGGVNADISFYTDAYTKVMTFLAGWIAVAINNWQMDAGMLVWEQTAAISRVKIDLPSGANLKAGSRLTIIGFG